MWSCSVARTMHVPKGRLRLRLLGGAQWPSRSLQAFGALSPAAARTDLEGCTGEGHGADASEPTLHRAFPNLDPSYTPAAADFRAALFHSAGANQIHTDARSDKPVCPM